MDHVEPNSVRVLAVRCVVDASFDAPAVLAELRKARRRQRLSDTDWIEAAYRVYITGLIGIAVTLFTSSAVGDTPLTTSQFSDFDAHGPAVVGLVVAAMIGMGLRSGSRGGPLALEAAEVRHVMLAPVERGAALRTGAWHQLRFMSFLGVAVGAVAGDLLSRRLHANAFAWVGAGTALGLLATVSMVGAALVSSGRRLHRPSATALAALLLAWAAADLQWQVWSPTRAYGSVALLARDVEPLGLVALAITVALVAFGLAGVGGLLVELAERRTGLVGQLRFAVTMQDLRTVIVLRRQLAQDTPRDRPWLATRRATRRFVVFRRGLRALLRFPAGRLVRLVILTVIGALSLRGAWHGTSPLIVVGALALYVAALDVIEPLAQQVDQADLTDGLPVESGVLLTRHVVVPAMAMLVLGGLGWGVVLAAEADMDAAGLAALLTVPAVLAALIGAVISVVMGAPEPASEMGQLMPPEAAGMKIAIRTALPLVMAVGGSFPVVIAAKALDKGNDPYAAATNVMGFVFAAMVLAMTWVRFRLPLKEWFRQSMHEGQQAARDRQRGKVNA